MERDWGMEGREGVSFHAREYWRPNRLVSFKTVATPVLFMGRRERKKAPNKTETNIAKEKLLWQCIHSRWEAMKLMRPLTAKEQSVVFGAPLKGIGSPSEILASQDGDSVQRGSMQTLRPGIWLNNEVINYFLKNCLKSRDIKICAKESGRRRSHFFNSFFVQTMFDEKNINKKLRGKYNYEKVKGWSKNVPGKDIFNLKYIFFPINIKNMHWTVAVIFMEAKRIQYYDSMGKTDWAKMEGLLQYVKDKYRVKNGKEMDEMDAIEWKLVSCKKDTPRQENGELYLSVLGRDECN
jgi:sentrin-specific protease 1